MELTTLWFVIIAVLWTGYLVLEGFDFGVGILLPILSRERDPEIRDKERRVVINSIGPVWDGNEVWLLTAGGATFAAFPEWYATLFSGFYLPLLLILLALIVRGVCFEYRGKVSDPGWARWCDRGIVFGSWLPSILWGVAFANLVRGVELDQAHNYVGGFWALLNPFALLGGLVTLTVFVTHGAVFLALKTRGTIHERALRVARPMSVVTLVVAGAWALWAQLSYSRNDWTWAAVAVAALALVALVATVWLDHEGWAFAFSAVAIIAAVALIFGSMYPNVMPAHDAANSLTVDNASSTHYTLVIMTWVAVVLTPLVLLYQGWTYWVFRKRLTAEAIPDPIGLTLRAAAFDDAPAGPAASGSTSPR
ncbi:cytochrome d ubiquinol oxidase subunit II [Luteimicrobium xylanilyticum]|uniref:Ubiquinol oxidase (Electrogenic, non H(+)-transporting) n=1 Tax=Luteimicrobium xylanilyticum TaxID=1133546 RepID=A0A5P9QC54_9MICO|nr:cytochrome d ubiquinol oxidase subunit II [Luteimicrobium xylanilyticum]QFU98816.1 Ubiquinol oxidase (electrogenic, non H(+)-transporting) [Luteimicrobium xylanilyticum]